MSTVKREIIYIVTGFGDRTHAGGQIPIIPSWLLVADGNICGTSQVVAIVDTTQLL
jgi:hypothetical protein